jgi:hypothetical protein
VGMEKSLSEEVQVAWTAGVSVHHLGDITGNLKRVRNSGR